MPAASLKNQGARAAGGAGRQRGGRAFTRLARGVQMLDPEAVPQSGHVARGKNARRRGPLPLVHQRPSSTSSPAPAARSTGADPDAGHRQVGQRLLLRQSHAIGRDGLATAFSRTSTPSPRDRSVARGWGHH